MNPLIPLALLVIGGAALLSSGSAGSGDRFDNLYRAAAAKYSVPFLWLKTIAIQESDEGEAPSVAQGILSPHDIAGSVSSDGKSWGLMQETLATASSLYGSQVTPDMLNDPGFSVNLAAQLLSQLIDTYGIDFEKVMRAYNGGPKANDPANASYSKTTPYFQSTTQILANLRQDYPNEA